MSVDARQTATREKPKDTEQICLDIIAPILQVFAGLKYMALFRGWEIVQKCGINYSSYMVATICPLGEGVVGSLGPYEDKSLINRER